MRGDARELGYSGNGAAAVAGSDISSCGGILPMRCAGATEIGGIFLE